MVQQAVFSNPFGDERDRIDKQLAGADNHVGRQELLDLLLSKVSAKVEQLDTADRADIRRYDGTDLLALQSTLLFEIFHRHTDQLDQLILDQIEAGETPCPVPFARDVIGPMTQRGFSQEAAVRYFGMFYQMRRAFHFIDRGLLGSSSSMRLLRRALWNNVFTHDILLYERYLWNRMEDFSTLLLGETGTGKGTAAAAIGRSGYIPYDERKQSFSVSFTETFLPINLSQFPETLIESELFGHRKGAFTGAVDAHLGVFEHCSEHGAIFLDEIGDVSIPVQIKLLQVLQERVFSRVGSHDKQRFNGRVVAATNKSIDALRQEGQFRDDFFYRLCSDCITVPPLRQRLAEDPAELDQLIRKVIFRLIGQPSEELSDTVREAIDRDLGSDYPWPGNVRELEQCARRVLLTRHYSGDRRETRQDLTSQLIEGVVNGTLDARSLMACYCRLLYERHGTYEEVARRTDLDRRTVKKYVGHS